jgi:DNA polymerase-1
MNRLVLIDGNAILHRAYHALPPLTAPDGSVVNAVYGFGTMLLRLIGDLKPSHVAVAFDRPKPTFRKKLFAGYQAKRPKMDEELADQIPKIHALLSGFGIPIFEKDGFEADDVIGTIAKHAKKDGINQVIIVTGDRDMLQLVEDEKILVWMPTKGLSEAKLYDEKAVKERMGVAPDKIPDFKALAGDPSDNYPGVPGIGPKTAVALLTKYKTIEDVLKTKELTKTEKESARMSHDLATIRTNVPLEGSLEPLGSLNRPEAIRELTTLGFRTLLKRITGEVGEEEKAKKAAQKAKKADSHQQELF